MSAGCLSHETEGCLVADWHQEATAWIEILRLVRGLSKFIYP